MNATINLEFISPLKFAYFKPNYFGMNALCMWMCAKMDLDFLDWVDWFKNKLRNLERVVQKVSFFVDDLKEINK